jgi:hypothetical protein
MPKRTGANANSWGSLTFSGLVNRNLGSTPALRSRCTAGQQWVFLKQGRAGGICPAPSPHSVAHLPFRPRREKALTDWRLRIGLDLGDVILEQGDGEGVNVAAGLEALAKRRHSRSKLTLRIAASIRSRISRGSSYTRVQWRQSLLGATSRVNVGVLAPAAPIATEPDTRAGSCKTRSAA